MISKQNSNWEYLKGRWYLQKGHLTILLTSTFPSRHLKQCTWEQGRDLESSRSSSLVTQNPHFTCSTV